MMNDRSEVSKPSNDSIQEIRIGISSCLLGEKVRFDGGHKHERFLTDTVGRFVQFVPVCPEVDIGLGTPREAIHLERRSDGVHLVGSRSGADHTAAMRRYAERKITEIGRLDLCGYILKKDSPTCGMERVRVVGSDGQRTRDGRGLFAQVLMERMPLLPVEEEGRLNDPQLRENFFERVFAFRRLKTLFGGPWRVGSLVNFHTTEKLLLLAHDRPAFQELGRLVAGAKGRRRHDVADDYGSLFMSALAKPATVRKHRNVLEHMAGYFKRTLEPDEKRELAGVIADYANGLVPLVVPLTLIRHHVRRFAVAYLAGQTYLEPHPKELMLRNHA